MDLFSVGRTVKSTPLGGVRVLLFWRLQRPESKLERVGYSNVSHLGGRMFALEGSKVLWRTHSAPEPPRVVESIVGVLPLCHVEAFFFMFDNILPT